MLKALLGIIIIISAFYPSLTYPAYIGHFITEITINLPERPTPPIEEENLANSKFVAENGDVRCLCVAYARSQGMKIPYPTNADQLVPNGTPDLGNGILFNYNGVKHLAVIKGFTNDGWLITESNKKPCQITERIVSYNDKFIIGFIKK